MGKAATQFALEIDAELIEAKTQIRTIVRRIALVALRKIIDRTPVANPSLWKNPDPSHVGGLARGNWNVSIGGTSDLVSTTKDADGGATINKGQSVIATYPDDGNFPTIWIQNNLDYIVPLETGHSSQAPAGMVGITVAELQSMLEVA